MDNKAKKIKIQKDFEKHRKIGDLLNLHSHERKHNREMLDKMNNTTLQHLADTIRNYQPEILKLKSKEEYRIKRFKQDTSIEGVFKGLENLKLT
jgi:trans-2-enoyl-CoA reductase